MTIRSMVNAGGVSRIFGSLEGFRESWVSGKYVLGG